MRRAFIIMGAAAVLGSTGCSTPKTSNAAVGPNPAGVAVGTGNGDLEVFSAFSAQFEGNNPTWRQHSDYFVLNSHGRRVKHVTNAEGYYSTLPRLVTLPAGKYVVKARAKDNSLMTVPVVIKPNEITVVHLDGNWQPGVSGHEVVMGPEGYPIGWRAGR